MLAPTTLLDAATGALARDAVAVPIAVPAAHVITALWAMARHDYRRGRSIVYSYLSHLSLNFRPHHHAPTNPWPYAARLHHS